jgi:hypothetical protein
VLDRHVLQISASFVYSDDGGVTRIFGDARLYDAKISVVTTQLDAAVQGGGDNSMTAAVQPGRRLFEECGGPLGLQ